MHRAIISVDRLVGSIDQPSIQVIFKATAVLSPLHRSFDLSDCETFFLISIDER